MFFQYTQNKYPPKKTIITCHHNADFDALTSLIGISIFFPEAQLIFPGSQEKVVQTFFEDVVNPLFNFFLPKDADFEDIERLVVVDTNNFERISHLTPLLERHKLVSNQKTENHFNSLEIIVFDHHPKGDIVAQGGNIEMVGSTSTLVIEEIKSVFGKIPCELANILGLGIYIDTGSFSYVSTTQRDYLAAAWIMEHGFLPDFAGQYTHRNLNKEQLSVLTSLVDSAKIMEVAGLKFVIVFARIDFYLSDFATLAPKIMDLVPCDVLFALASMKNSTQVVARSKDDSFDVGKICTQLGGGGHQYAAAAMVKEMTLHEVINFLQSKISMLAHTDKTAKRLMTSPAIVAYGNDSIIKAEAIMSHYGLKAIPICKEGTKICIGWLEQQLALKAINHGIGEISVTSYMSRQFKVISPDANLQTLMDIIVGERQRLIPVVDTSFLPNVPSDHS